jgi:hypothetical protein
MFPDENESQLFTRDPMKRRDFITRSLAGAALTAIGTSCNRVEKYYSPSSGEGFASSHYTRMFPTLARPPSVLDSRLERGLIELAAKMVDSELSSSVGPGLPESGYTYLGQFIDHDLTFDLTPLIHAHPETWRTINFRTPFLDLDHVYGGGPNVSPFLYDRQSKRGEERFLLGTTITPEGKKSRPNDLPRNALGTALVGDPRQDENLILAQLHVAFLTFHNRVLERSDILKSSPFREAGSPFEAARRFVTWHYQWFIWNDFVKTMIDLTAFDHLNARRWSGATAGCFQMPVEFSVAAFRFGHSLVRDQYPFNDQHTDPPADLALNLLQLTGASETGMLALPDEWVINWRLFFGFEGSNPLTTPARKIDTMIANGLHSVPLATVKLFNAVPRSDAPPSAAPSHLSLPARTLLRGARVGLPTGQDVANALGAEPVDLSTGQGADVLQNYGLDRDTPLWYYILQEASLLPRDGRRLGPVGSRIIAETIRAALQADPNSYLSLLPSWTPTLPYSQTHRFRDILTFTFPELKG